MSPSETSDTYRRKERQHRGALVDMLLALVPMRMMELAGLDAARLQLHLDRMPCDACTPKQGDCRGVATILGTHGADLMFNVTTSHGRRSRSAARRALVDGLAVAALLADGGVWSFAGLHFCAHPHEGCPNPGGRPTVPRRIADPAPAERSQPHPMDTVPLGPLGQVAL